MRNEQTVRYVAVAGVLISGMLFPGVSLITAWLVWRFFFDGDPTMHRPLFAAGVVMTVLTGAVAGWLLLGS